MFKKAKNYLMTNPSLFIALTFAFVILLGTILLMQSFSTRAGVKTAFIDALFTSTSAVCVTGLVVENTYEYWSFFGQLIIMILIQFGGLGFMTIATTIFLFAGKRINFRNRILIKEQLNQDSLDGMVKLVINVIKVTFFVELFAAVLMAFIFIPAYGIKRGLWASLFHSVSAFCNAGFDVTGNSMMTFQNNWLINLTICGLVFTGGLGFSVVSDVMDRKKRGKFNLHTKIVLTTSIFLIIFGTIMFLLTEYSNDLTMGNASFLQKILRSFFQSVISRTAGFNSVSINALRESTVMIIIFLMFVGASPGSTGGGIKTTTASILLLGTISEVKRKQDITVFKKRLPSALFKKALAITLIAFLWVFIIAFILTMTENKNFLDLLFETVSAFGTVGLSRGVTPELTFVGKILITLTMYIGRVGVLTLAIVLSGENRKTDRFRYAEESVIVG